jgi:alpha-beta hydrolase superfamily lysophospholipase
MNRKNLLSIAFTLAMTACGTPYMPARTPQVAVAQPEGTKHDQGQFEGVGKTQLYWQSWQPTKVQKRGVVVVVHGLKDHSSRYADFAHDLNAKGYGVYAFDLRGHGYSAGNRVTTQLFDDYVMDLDIFLTRVMLDERAPVFVFGHSMGGAIVTLHEIMYHPHVRGIILSAAALEPGVSGAKIDATNLTDAIFPDFDVFDLDVNQLSRDPAVVHEVRRDPLVYQGAAPAHMAAELVGGIQAIGATMESVDAPLLILHGKADQVTPPAGSKLLYERASSKDKTLSLYGNMVHDLLHEPEKATVVKDIETWLDARSDSR